MTQLLEEYLVCLEWQQDKYLREKLLISAFERRNIDFEEFKKKTGVLIKELDNLPFRDEDYYFSKMEMQRKLYYQSNANGEIETDEIIESVIENLDSFYSLARLKITNEISALKDSKSASVSKKQAEILDGNNSLLQIYSNIKKLYEQNGEIIYMHTKNLFVESIEMIRPSEQKFVIKFLLGFAIRQVRVDPKYLREIFNLYKIAHENNLLVINGILTNATFINIVTTASRIGEFDWAELFVDKNQEKIESKTKNEIIALGRGFIAFYKWEFSNVIDLLSNLDFKDILYQLLAKSLSLQAYFELFLKNESYFAFIKTYSQAFEKYLSRNPEIGKKKLNSYISFIRFVKSLAGIIYHKELTEERRLMLLKELERKKEIVERNWLKSKIEENRRGTIK
jgi:hypothetical protein